MNLLYLKKFNNYYNRRVKYYSDVDEYIASSEDYTFNDRVDFNPGDDVVTYKTANLDAVSFHPDYLLVLDENDAHNIISRWFVLEMKRERNGQYTMTFKRDVIADHFEQLKGSPMFVYKGNLKADNALIYNNESVSVNQIKTKEWLLKDFTKTSWIVGYVANDSFTTAQTYEVVNKDELNNAISIESLSLTLQDPDHPEYGGIINQINKVALQINVYAMWQLTTIIPGVLYWDASYYTKSIACDYNYDTNSVSDGYRSNIIASGSSTTSIRYPGYKKPGKELLTAYKSAVENNKSAVVNGLEAYFSGKDIDPANLDEYNEIYALDGKVVKSNSTGLYYRLEIASQTTEKVKDNLSTAPSEVSLYRAIQACASQTAAEVDAEYTPNDAGNVAIEYSDIKTIVNFIPLPGAGDAKVEITANHRILEDAPYSMFCLRNTPLNLTLAMKMVEKLDDKCYDLQLLPYCPVANKVFVTNIAFDPDIGPTPGGGSDNEITPNPRAVIVTPSIAGQPVPNLLAEEGKDYFNITDAEDNVIDYLFFATVSQGSFIIKRSIETINDPIEIKIANDCDSYRLCSPNYNGIFEFNAVKNGGVDYFEINYTYKPFQPYIHVNPNFKNLYGKDFNDARGLICGGDFSLPRVKDAWAGYEIQNKNYTKIFDRQIETLDRNNQLNLMSQAISTPINAASTGIGVGVLSGKAGVGGAAGAASLLGGLADIGIGQSIYQNNRQAQIDLFNLNLQNIQALPNSLTKVGAYNIDNKIFPFIEYYTCTDTEKEALRNKIKYEAMTVNAIGTIDDYIGAVEEYNYFKASPIILDNIAEDYHLAEAIAVELEKGVYL